jgi:tetratricopeptide (TPR) repeat protein
MEPLKKNRMKIESVEPENDPSVTQYETEDYTAFRDKQIRQNSSFVPWALFIFIFLLVAGFGVWYQFLRKSEVFTENLPKQDILEKTGNIDHLLEKPYLPESSLNPALAKCITLYRDRYVKKAMAACEEFMNTPGSDTEKSIALTVSGVMFDEAGRYMQAIEKLTRAVDYDARNVHAYYNLTLAYKHMGQYPEARKTILKAKQIAPNDSRIILLAGNLLNETNDTKGAIETYKDGLSSSPNDPYLVYNLAVSLYKQGSVVDAIENFKKAILLSKNGQVAEFSHGYLGTIYYHRDDLDGAEHHFREAFSIKPNEAKYAYNLGLILLKKKKNEEALGFFQKALDAGTNDPQIYRYIAESFEDLKMHENAIVALERALTIRPDDIDTMFQLADLYYNKGNLSRAEDLFRRLVKITPGDTNTENALVNLGIILDDMERHSEAISALEQAISINPKNDTAYYNLGIAYKNAGQPTRAIENWKKASALNPTEPKNQEAIGDYYFQSGYYVESAKEYEEVSRANPFQYKLKLKLADSYFKLKNYDQAEKQLIYVLNNSKESVEIKNAHRKLALVYAEGDSKNKSRAKDEAYRGSHMDPDDMESKLVLAKVLMDSNSMMDREKAIDELTAVVRSDVSPKIAAQAYNYLGLCFYKNGEYKKALREFQNSIDLDPTLTEAYDNKRAARASYEDSIQGRNSKF